ncbi:MAG: hypothetical protein PHW83_13620 [Bacteroidales bacterium]|nr:hypothetical protein [Bacteroidales bacterium]
MKSVINILFITVLTGFFITACNNSETDKKSAKELELQKRELDLKQKDLGLKEKELSQQNEVLAESEKKPTLDKDSITISNAKAIEVSYKKFTTAFFSIDIPSTFTIESDNDKTSLDYCDYSVKTKEGVKIIQIHSLTSSRFETSEAMELYEIAISKSELTISYKTQKDNWFVISGTDKETGMTIYWKRVSGKNYISDLRIDYSASQKTNIEPYIGKIAGSFISY